MFTKTIIVGNIGQDAQVREISGSKVINFSVAHTEKYKDQDGQQVNKTVWYNCSYWNDKIKVAKYLRKGNQVLVEGEISTKVFKNKEGVYVSSLNLRVLSIKLLSTMNNRIIEVLKKKYPGYYDTIIDLIKKEDNKSDESFPATSQSNHKQAEKDFNSGQGNSKAQAELVHSSDSQDYTDPGDGLPI